MRVLSESGLENQRVLVQMSLDVHMEDGIITDDSRLRASLDTIKWLLERNNSVVLMGHVGRPKGVDASLSSKPCAVRMSELLGQPVAHIAMNDEVTIGNAPLGSVFMLENLRFDARQVEGDTTFGQELAHLGDAFVNDDYPDAHRASATNVVLPRLLPSYAGFCLEREYRAVMTAIENPARPFVLLIGGAKADKIGVIDNMLGIADHIIVGGVLANTFLRASGVDVKGSRVDETSLEIAGEFLRDQEEKFCLPTDVVVAEKFTEDAQFKEVPLSDVPEGWVIMDIGSQTVHRYEHVLADAGTIVWGGPIGVYEFDNFKRGTEEVGKFIANSDAFSLIAGGDSGDAVKSMGLAERMSHVSIGGGATLALIAGQELPAISSLTDEQ